MFDHLNVSDATSAIYRGQVEQLVPITEKEGTVMVIENNDSPYKIVQQIIQKISLLTDNK